VEPPSTSATPGGGGGDGLYTKTPGVGDGGGLSRAISLATLPVQGRGEPESTSTDQSSQSPVREDDYSSMPSQVQSLSTTPGKSDGLYSSMPSEVPSVAGTPGKRDNLYGSMPARGDGEDDRGSNDNSNEDEDWMNNEDHSSAASLDD
jgi:hypothetical protein